MINLSGKTALVTGGGRGIGKAISLSLAKAGANVIITFISNKKDAFETAGKVAGNSIADVYQIDISYKQSVREFASWIGNIDILVNNAGINIPNDFDKIDDFQELMTVNLYGTFNITQTLFPQINDGGSIINMGSVSAFIGGPRSTHYCASKAGLVGLTQNVALWGAKRNIRCNLVAPGYIVSPMADEGMADDSVQKVVENIPLGRLGTANEVANVVAFLASDLSSYITGQALHVNGGLYW